MAYFPFMIEIGGQRCLVVGGGRIALHKVRILRNFGVAIRVTGTVICRELRELAEQSGSPRQEPEEQVSSLRQEPEGQGGGSDSRIELCERAFRDSDLEGMDFVVAATEDEALNLHISELCRQRRLLVNAVDMKEACSFIFPAILQDMDLLVAVSTGGQSPAAAAYVKRQIRESLPDYYGKLIGSMGEYRDDILSQVDTAEQRKRVFDRLLEYGAAHGGELPRDVAERLIAEAGAGTDGTERINGGTEHIGTEEQDHMLGKSEYIEGSEECHGE